MEKVKRLGAKTLETERLILRKFMESDICNMYKNWASNDLTSRYLPWNTHEDVETTKEVVTSWIKGYENNDINYVVELKSTHEIIGSISVVNDNYDNFNCEVGYCYGPNWWGKGYATEALKRLIEYLIVECNYYLVMAKHMKSNPASGRVMQKSGMTYDGFLRKRQLNKITNRLDDIVYYSITKDEFLNKNEEN